MPDLPTGMVTLLFTDIEGSTRLWEQHPEAMPAALARHDTILYDAIVDQGGVIFRTVGDAFYAAFSVARAALIAALTAQRALHDEPWGEIGCLRVRMALHTGVVELRDDTSDPTGHSYIGPALNRVARLLATAHGGQTLLCRATQVLVRDQLPPDVLLRDLDEHQLRDLIQPEHIFQLIIPGVPAEFPPLKTATQHDLDMPAEKPFEELGESNSQSWKQAKLPDMPGIDYDTVWRLERERALQRRKRKKKKTDNPGGMF
jgi:class 3 adenylate cyclase